MTRGKEVHLNLFTAEEYKNLLVEKSYTGY